MKGKRLLHLQCHVGLDSISWALRGARVTAVDFSPEALEFGRRLAEEMHAEVEFVESDVYALPRRLRRRSGYDIVFTSYGVLWWLPDLGRWARIAAHFLRPGGRFYIIEHHPFATIFGDRWHGDGRTPVMSYFQGKVPLRTKLHGSVAGKREVVAAPQHYGWVHPLGEVVESLISADLRIAYLHEFPVSDFPQFSFMKRAGDRMWRMPPGLDKIPMTYSILAVKPPRQAGPDVRSSDDRDSSSLFWKHARR